ncbi:family 20 glycosylhydrolase [Microbacterium soli]|uniref:Glycoside hydrolase family 20 catalytic domain-containing protein n=1 Tax=Microbacterium soli TaxID=446075 RepID=A0ABP7N5Z5_9MICO
MTGHAHPQVDPGWFGLPRPAEVLPGSGRWQASAVRVTADDPQLTGEAARFARELADLGIGYGDEATVRLVRGRAGVSSESFFIDVDDDITIVVATAAGAFRATRQLLHNLRARRFVPRARVRSSPSVPERGLHLDAARKHYPAEWIAHLLHTLADVGINALQWHVSENEGFRVGSAAFPEIVSPEHISRTDAVRLADLAADLHIDLIPSLDMPGHLRHVLAQHPRLRLPPTGDPLDDAALNITDPAAVAFALALIDDVAALFPHSRRWHLGGDEFIDLTRTHEHELLRRTAHERLGPSASGFDLLTDFVNRVAAHLRGRGLAPRVWNDGMLRGEAVELDADVALTWWTNWHPAMQPLQRAVRTGRELVNFNDGLLYHVLGEKAGYRYPTAERIWGADWHPGLFPALPDGTRQELPAPYPAQLRGAFFSVWSDDPQAQTAHDVMRGIRRPLRAMAERSWNGGSTLSLAEFTELEERIGTVADTIGFP